LSLIETNDTKMKRTAPIFNIMHNMTWTKFLSIKTITNHGRFWACTIRLYCYYIITTWKRNYYDFLEDVLDAGKNCRSFGSFLWIPYVRRW